MKRSNSIILKNGYLCATIKFVGAELISLKDVNSSKEYIWKGKKGIWKDHCYNIFPICGRLKNDLYQINGQEYQMPLHGFALKSKFDVISQNESSVLLSIRANKKTRECFPYKFEYQVKYELIKRKIVVSYNVINLGNQTMWFSLGAHPGISLDINEQIKFKDYYLELDSKKYTKYLLDDKRLLSDCCKVKRSNIIKLNRKMFVPCANVFEVNANTVTLKNHINNEKITVEMKDFPYLVLWTTKRAKLIAIEPWQTHSASENGEQDISKRPNFSSLEANRSLTKSWSLEV